jgi:hypothetical protein
VTGAVRGGVEPLEEAVGIEGEQQGGQEGGGSR